MAKVRHSRPEDGYIDPVLLHYCPGCGVNHGFAVDQPFRNGARWSFNGDFESPTFQPSMNIAVGPFPGEDEAERCHYFVTDGNIQYLSDSTHHLSGQTVPLIDMED